MATDQFDTTSSNQPPAQPPAAVRHDQLAADLIREKVARVYATEPAANEELTEASAAGQRSKHQQFMYDLSRSGKDLAAIQTEWHNYYQGLPPDEQHQVWHEFYASQSALTRQPSATYDPQALSEHKQQAARPIATVPAKPRKLRDARSTKDVQAAIRDTVTAGGQLGVKHHFQSLLFGLGMGALVVFIFLFGFFNEILIAPFIQPSRASAATPLIISSTSVAPTPDPEVIIPKINVEIPVNYNETSTNEATIENDLEGGVVHYPTTVMPGQNGNAAFFGHSSNNIFNKGKYKFAFVLLHTLVPGDTFYLTYHDKVYVYKVLTKNIVSPNDVSVLGPVPGQTATATLITCDPPGTSLNRLIIVGQQISPDPSGNTAATTTAAPVTSTAQTLPGNGQTLWSRFIQTAAGKTITVVVCVGAGLYFLRRLNHRVMGHHKPLR
jgi:LPXTG-site transpeptidase (sortase) family protein